MLTPEQINEIRAKSGLKPIGQSKNANVVGRFDYLKKQQESTDNLKGDLSKRIGSIKTSFASGKSRNPIQGFNDSLNILGQTAGGILDIGERIGEKIFDTGTTELSKHISGTPTKAEQNIKQAGLDILDSTAGKIAIDAIKNGVEAYSDFKVKHPDIARDIENVINVTAVLPMAKTAIKGTSVLAKSATKAAGKTVKPIIKGTGELLEATGKISAKSAIPLNSQEAALVQAYKAKNPLLKRVLGEAEQEPRTAALTAYEKGFMGTESMIGVQARREATKIWDDVKPVLNNIEEKIKTADVFDSILNKIIKKVKEPGRQGSLVDALEAMADDYKGITEMSHSFAQDIKSDLYKFIPDKVWKGKPIASSLRDVQAMFAQELRNRTRAALKDSPEALKAFDDYGNLKALMEFGKSAMTGSKRKGGFGGFVNSLYENATVPIKTISGQILKRTGELLKK